MYMLTIETYYRQVGDSMKEVQFFDTKKEAVDYAKQYDDINCTIWLEKCRPCGNDEYTWGGVNADVKELRSAVYY